MAHRENEQKTERRRKKELYNEYYNSRWINPLLSEYMRRDDDYLQSDKKKEILSYCYQIATFFHSLSLKTSV